ncbi:MAG: riboflavin synthase [Bryobacteraceae bacterium]|nr:riboflavin synthase [Bryobacteraceae bacterium]
MFTGIIEELGAVESIQVGDSGRLRIHAPLVCSDLHVGDSVSVNGVCLTAVEVRGASFEADASPETLSRSSLSSLKRGGMVNLERALLLTSRLGGHIVQGHVDGTGQVVAAQPLGDGNWELSVRYPAELDRYLVSKGSVSVDGISLTIASIEGGVFSVAVIPHTWEHTNLRARRPGDVVNLETDILAKYVEKLLTGAPAPEKLSVEKLLDMGY